MIDRSLLPSADLEFVVIADTHYFDDLADRPVEFASRRKQSARAEHALRLAAALNPAFVVHLGDLAQAVPESAEFATMQQRALDQLTDCGIRPRHVAGNQDIGDKPDPTMPTAWVTPESLATYHQRFGRSWYSFAAADRHCIVINSQIMNSALPEASEQRAWLEAELAAHAERRMLLFTHLPLFLRDEGEAHLGHYDNLGQPDRGWLVTLIRRFQIELVVVGHSHWSFFNRIGTTRYYVAPSTSHTRPGFSELFSSAPPPEQGRDDAAKLGFYLVRLHPDRPRMHLIRTNGETAPPDDTTGDLLLTRLPSDLPHGRLGITLTHPLAATLDLPLAWPSAIRQPARNDYPLLACLELGARHVRVPLQDLRDPIQRERLAVLRDEGVAITATWLCDGDLADLALIDAYAEFLEGIELQVPGSPWPTVAILDALRRLRREHHCTLSLAALVPNQLVPGKQLRRTRIGYQLDELPTLARLLADAGLTIDRVVCHLPATLATRGLPPPHSAAFPSIGAIDWAFDADVRDDDLLLHRAARALWHVATLPDSRLYVEPYLDLDRTMDSGLGLLDRRCNPRPAFQALRCLNTLLFRQPAPPQPVGIEAPPGAYLACVQLPRERIWFVTPERAVSAPIMLTVSHLAASTASVAHGSRIDLMSGRSYPLQPRFTIDRPNLIRIPSAPAEPDSPAARHQESPRDQPSGAKRAAGQPRQ